MASGVKSSDESLFGRRVEVSWPKHKAFAEGVELHSHSGKNLVVCTHGVEQLLNLKMGNREPVNDIVSDMFKHQDEGLKVYVRKKYRQLPERPASKAYGGELVGCRIKVWRIKSNMFSEGVVASYNCSNKKHLVVYTDGVEEMLNLNKHAETAEDVPANQTQKTPPPAREFSSTYTDDDMDAHLHERKKHKGPSSDRTTHFASPESSKDLKTPKLEADISPTDSKSITGDLGLINVDGYKVKASSAPILEAIFEEYGDIAARCIFRSSSVRASVLEVVCNVVQKLQHHDLEAILSDLENIETEVSDVEDSKINISWLKEHLEQLRRVVPFKEKSIELRKTKARIGFISRAASNELKERQAELDLAMERFKEAEKRVNAVNLVSNKVGDDILECELEEYFWRRRIGRLL